MKLSIIAACCLSALTHISSADDLPRRGTIGLGGQPVAGGLQIAVVRPNGPASRAGLKPGDVIQSVNGTPIASQNDFANIIRTIAGGSNVTLRITRDNAPQDVQVTLDATPAEVIDGSTVTYSSVTVPDGYKLRTIISTPDNSPLAKDGKAPAFLFVQGIYCASLDRPQAPDAVDTRLVRAMAKAGYATLRVDKPGLGDSQGPPCSEINFKTELAGYKAALKQIKSLPGVDPTRVYVFGHSMGGVMMPYLVQDTPVRGAIVYGTLARTWFEYQFENARRQMGLSGASEGDISEALQGEAKSSAMILVEKKTLGDVWARYPELKQEDPMLDATHMSSRHMSFYHDLQDLNLARAWEQVATNVLAIHGEYDWVTTGADHDLIAKIVNAKTPGFASSITLPKADHGFTLHDSLQASLGAMGQGKWDGSLPKAVLDWIDTVEGRAQPKHETTTGSANSNAPEAPTIAKASAAAPATKPTFPQSWLGRWKGDATSGDGVNAQKFTTELIIAATEKPDRFQWTLIYDGGSGHQERKYFLVAKDAAKGLYQIDEGNGIVLESRYIDGTLFSHFLVQGNRIITRDRLENFGTADEHISIEMITSVDAQASSTGGKEGSPEVTTWSPSSIQKATLRRVNDAATAAAPPAPIAASDALPKWTKLKTERYPGKQDDIFFVSPTTGWYVNGAGKIFKTTDAGATWTLKLHKPGTYFRCLAFVDDKIGFAGNIGPDYFPNVTDTVPLYQTADGGDTWTPVTTIDGPAIVGLCALEVVKTPFVNAGNLDHKIRIVGVGRVGGPSAGIYSDDLGKTWQRMSLPPSCAMAFDVHFFDNTHGVIASATSTDVQSSKALILTTEDGGTTWREAFTGSREFELTWKISFPSRNVGYVTIQSYNPDPSASQRFIAKTTDGGKTWAEIPLVDDAKVRQFGIAFVDDNIGWVGAMPHGFGTTDGGKTWSNVDFGNAVNKIRILRDPAGTFLHAIGGDVHTLKRDPSASK
jgi:photosystem II stability/assembly factor-like uncharacterized protein/pimeloyl-ACP methyl ester carboxylesterase